jgi:hypothetical protein
MNIHSQWHQHVNAWRESGLSQADYCRQQDLNPKTLSAWTRRALPIDKDTPLEMMAVQVTPSESVAIADANLILRFAHDVELELSTAVSPRWLAELLRCLA